MRSIIASVAILLASAHAGFAAPIVVQPIIVCGTGGVGCAADPTIAGGTYQTLFNQNVLNTIYAQTKGTDYAGTAFPGVQFTLLAPTYYDNSSYLTTTIDLDTSTVGGVTTLVSNPVDQAHQLLRLPNPAASTNPTTLNVYLVDHLQLTQNGVLTNGIVHGFGLTSSNGAVIDAGANIDSLAHELGHNLGLVHVDSLPNMTNNLMQSSGRILPSSVNDPTIGKTIDLLSGANGNDQIAQANQPLFTVNLASAVAGAWPGHPTAPYCQTGSLNCGIYFSSNPASGTESLTEIRLRWLGSTGDFLNSAVIDTDLHGIVAWSSVTDAAGCANNSTSLHSLVGGGTELDLFIPSGCMTPGRVTSLVFELQGNPTGYPGDLTDLWQIPFSVEWDFADGITSNALFDATGNAVSPDVVTVSGINTSGFPDEFLDIVTLAPEPRSGILLAGALALLLPFVRHSRSIVATSSRRRIRAYIFIALSRL